MNAIFLIEGGRALELVKQHIAEVQRVRAANLAVAQDLGVEKIQTDREDGRMVGACFKGQPPKGWKQPDRMGVSRPKRGTEAASRLAELKGYPAASELIERELKVPTMLRYADTATIGGRVLGCPFSACGFAWLSVHSGPYGMWIPNVAEEVAKEEAAGRMVDAECKNFPMTFEGCRRIESEEWDILVAQHKLKEKAAKAPVSV